jgi:hypothetical protein
MVQLTSEQRTFVIKTFYETNSLQQARVAFGLTNFAKLIIFNSQRWKNRQFLFDECVAISHRYDFKNVS